MPDDSVELGPRGVRATRRGGPSGLVAGSSPAGEPRTLPAASSAANGDRTRARRALASLVQQHLHAALGPATWAWWGAAELEPGAAWRALLPLPCGPEPRRPGESELDLALRLFALLEPELTEGERLLWSARSLRAEARDRPAVRHAEQALVALLESGGEPEPVRDRAALDLAECLLERGAPAAAEALLGARPASAYRDRLLGWSRLAQGDERGAREVLHARGPWAGRLPPPLVRLRAARPDWLPWLTGRGPESGGVHRGSAPAPCADELGARLLAVLALDATGHPRLLHLDAGRRGESARARLAGAGADREPERELVAMGERVCRHADPSAQSPLAEVAVGRGATRLLVLEPIPDGRGEVLGWVRAEFEHHLEPEPERLAAAARAWLEPALRARSGDADVDVAGERVDRLRETSALGELPGTDPRRDVFEHLVRELGARWTGRRWTGLALDATGGAASGTVPGRDRRPGPRTVCAAGGADVGSAVPGLSARLLGRSVLTRGPVRTTLGPDAPGSAACLPLLAEGEVVGALFVESARAAGLAPEDVERWAEPVAAAGPALRAAELRAWHASQYGWTPYFDAEGLASSPLLREVAALAGTRAPLAVRGLPGSGRTVLARWLARGAQGAAPRELRAGGPGATGWGDAPIVELLASTARRESVVVRGVEALDAGGQRHLAQRLAELRAAGAPGPHPVLVVEAPVNGGVPGEEGGLQPELANEVGRLALDVPDLAARRDELPALLGCLLATRARIEGLALPKLEPEAEGLVFRASWPGQVPQLAALVHRLVRLHSGRVLGAAELRGELERSGAVVRERIAPRTAAPEWVEAALHAARRSGGRVNKTRAAALLGWDPGTLGGWIRGGGEQGGGEGGVDLFGV